MRPLYNPSPERSHRLAVVPRHNCRAVLAFESNEGRYYPVVALASPLAEGLDPFTRLSPVPLPHLPQP